MSKFRQDLKNEQLLNEHLNKVYEKLNLEFVRKADMDSQYKGIDLVMKHDGEEYNVDEKAQLHYLNKNLQTFTFELSFYNRYGELKQGWLFDKKKETQYYFLVTNIQLKNYVLETSNDFKSCQIMSVNREKLINHLYKIGSTEGHL